jgi:hypothetical protein
LLPSPPLLLLLPPSLLLPWLLLLPLLPSPLLLPRLLVGSPVSLVWLPLTPSLLLLLLPLVWLLLLGLGTAASAALLLPSLVLLLLLVSNGAWLPKLLLRPGMLVLAVTVIDVVLFSPKAVVLVPAAVPAVLLDRESASSAASCSTCLTMAMACKMSSRLQDSHTQELQHQDTSRIG